MGADAAGPVYYNVLFSGNKEHKRMTLGSVASHFSIVGMSQLFIQDLTSTTLLCDQKIG